MTSPTIALERMLPKLPSPWNIVDDQRLSEARHQLIGTDLEVEAAMQAARATIEILAQMPIFDRSAVPPLEPSNLDLQSTRGWGDLFRRIEKRVSALEHFDRALVREILIEHTPVPDEFLDNACHWFLYRHFESVAGRTLIFVSRHRVRQRNSATATQLVDLAGRHWATLPLEVQLELLNATAMVAGEAAFEVLDDVTDGDVAHERLKAEAKRLKVYVYHQDHPVPGKSVII